MMRSWQLLAVWGALAFVGSVQSAGPNVLWLTAEDMSPQLGCYGDPQAVTPRLDAFAREAVRFDNTFATAPVCSPSRSCLISGVYATSLGTQRLRSQFPVPTDFRPFPALLREAGYYCTNNVKTDYNLRGEAKWIEAAWHESSPQAHWRGRQSGQPFFAVFNFMTTHQSRTSVWPADQFEQEIGARLPTAQRHQPEKLTLPPYYPDTTEARRAWARYYDCVTRMDQEAGELLDQLSADGLADDTIVIFYSDHGMGMPRGKRCLFDSGLRVPLLIRFPRKWSHWSPAAAGSATDRLVSFVDFAPTVLSLCGVTSPGYYQGNAFLGPHAGPERQFVYGARDRVDEAFDVARSVRDKRWLYIRNFMPHLSWMQPESYSDGSPFRRELKQLAAGGKLAEAAWSYAAPRRPREELYDTQQDPDQLHNLAGSPQSAERLRAMRAELRRWQLATRDVGFLAEPQVWQRIGEGTPWDLARDGKRYPLARLLEVADLVGDDDASERQRTALSDPDDGVRYWAAIGWHARRQLTDADRVALRAALVDESAVVRIEAAAALAAQGEIESSLPVLIAALEDKSPEVVLHGARALQLLGPAARPAVPAMRVALDAARQAESQGSDIGMFQRFSLEAALGVR